MNISEVSDIKILHVLKSNSYSGAENVVMTLIDSMRKTFPDKYEMIYVSPDGPIREVLKRENIIFEPLHSFSIKEIKRVGKKHKPDIVHAHDFTASILCAVAKNNNALISHLHQTTPWVSRVCAKTLVYISVLARYDKIVCVSPSLTEQFVFKSLADAVVLTNPIDINKIRKLAETSTRMEEYDIVFLGRLTPQKDPLRFISIVGELKSRFPKLKVAMIGGGEMRDECELAIKSAQLQDNLFLLGFVDNPNGVLSHAGLMCMPSVWEGFPMAVTEAMALGIPVVASKVGSLPEMLDESCGALCDSDEDFVSAITEILSSADIRALKSQNAQERAMRMDNLEAYDNKIDEMYCGL